jgi:predicted transcriptional regulator
MAVRLPDAITSRPDELTEGEWEALAKIVNAAIDRFEEFRKTEGGIYMKNLTEIFKILINI